MFFPNILKYYDMFQFMFKKTLLKDLGKIREIDAQKLKIDGESFSSGYANGYVKGFYRAVGIFVTIIAALIGIMCAMTIHLFK